MRLGLTLKSLAQGYQVILKNLHEYMSKKARSYLQGHLNSMQVGSNRMQFTAWKHTERNRHRDRKKNIYYDFMRFGDLSTVRKLLKQ